MTSDDKAPAVLHTVKRLSIVLEDIGGALDGLHERFRPVLRPDPPESVPVEEGPEEERDIHSDLTYTLQDMCANAVRLREHIERLYKQAEI